MWEWETKCTLHTIYSLIQYFKIIIGNNIYKLPFARE